jgi:hypothetical protein
VNNRVVHMTVASLAWLSSQLLKIAGERGGTPSDFPMSVARNGRPPINGKTPKREGPGTALRSVRRWPEAPGPFLMMILTLGRQSLASNYDRRESPVLPEGASFVVRYRSR